MSRQVIGIIGLGVMGQSLALNIERNGFSVAGFDLDEKRVETLCVRAEGKNIIVLRTLDDFLNHLESPKRILMMVPAGAPVDAVIRDVRPHLTSGDILID